MLWPFNKQRMVLYSTHPETIPTVVRDLTAKFKGFEGYVSAVCDARTYTLLIHQGEPIQHALVCYPGIIVPAPDMPETALKELGDEATLLAMELDHLMSAMLAVIFSRAADFTASTEAKPFFGGFEEAQHKSKFFLMALFINQVCMPALVKDGNVETAYCFDWSQRQFVRVRGTDEFLKYIEPLTDSQWTYSIYLHPIAYEHRFEFSLENDPFWRTSLAYKALFEEIKRILIKADEREGLKLIQKVLKAQKEKYPPLYQGVFINPETYEINWDRIFENRRRISHKYRYDSFFLYLDELLLTLIRLLHESIGVQGIVEIIRFVDKRRRLDFASPYHLTDVFYSKLNSLLKLDKYSPLGGTTQNPKQ